MITNNLSKETQSKLTDFFNNSVDSKDMAKYIRRVNFILAQTLIYEDQKRNAVNKEWLDSSFYYLNELAEILDPYLDVE
ncbi:hypothetical protein EV144_102325 [Flavobacterium sp. 270]|nr:hypothetical protein EV144_102325 [Flavobacterium sp. 270]